MDDITIIRPKEQSYNKDQVTIVGSAAPPPNEGVLIAETRPDTNYAEDAVLIYDFLRNHIPNGTYEELIALLNKNKGR